MVKSGLICHYFRRLRVPLRTPHGCMVQESSKYTDLIRRCLVCNSSANQSLATARRIANVRRRPPEQQGTQSKTPQMFKTVDVRRLALFTSTMSTFPLLLRKILTAWDRYFLREQKSEFGLCHSGAGLPSASGKLHAEGGVCPPDPRFSTLACRHAGDQALRAEHSHTKYPTTLGTH